MCLAIAERDGHFDADGPFLLITGHQVSQQQTRGRSVLCAIRDQIIPETAEPIFADRIQFWIQEVFGREQFKLTFFDGIVLLLEFRTLDESFIDGGNPSRTHLAHGRFIDWWITIPSEADRR